MATISINGTYFAFTTTAANATIGATYTNNGNTYTVNATIAGGTTLYVKSVYSTDTPTTSGTLTKASGTGDATITFSAYSLTAQIGAITYAAGDTFNVYGNETLLINQTPTALMGPITINNAATTGKVLVENTSTTTPIVISLNTNNSDITATYLPNIFQVRGDWITIATGDGTASQTIDFNTAVGGVAIDWPSIVWIETGDTRHKQLDAPGGSGYFMPFFNCGKGGGANTAPDYDVLNYNILTEFYGDLDHGPVFQYDLTTKIATFGNGGVVGTSNGGAVIPNGARVLYPNIHFTSSTYNVTNTNRNQLVASNGGQIDIDICGFSRNWFLGGAFATGGDMTFSNIGCTGRFPLANNIGTLTVNNLAIANDCSAPITSSSFVTFSSNIGDAYLDYVWLIGKSNGTYCPHLQIGTTTKIKQFTNIFSWAINSTTGSFPIIFDSVVNPEEAPVQVGPFYIVGGQLYMLRVDNFHVKEVWHSAKTTAVADTLSSYGIVCGYFKNSVIAKVRRFTNGVAPRIYMVSSDASSVQYAIKDIVYDGQSNTQAILSLGGQDAYAANINVDNLRSTMLVGTVAQQNVRLSNLYSNSILTNTVYSEGGFFEWPMSSTTSFTSTVSYDTQPFNPYWTNTSKTEGMISIGPFGMNKNINTVEVISGTLGTDWYAASNAIVAPNAGVELIFTNIWPIRGVTDFTGATFTTAHTGFTTGAAMEFSLRVNDGTDTSPWTAWADATTAANWQTALASLSGYTSEKGFFPRFRLTTTTYSASRAYNYSRLTCTPDSTWTPSEIGYVPITVSGQVNDSCVKLYDNTVPATPIAVKTQIITASPTIMRLPYDFDAVAKPFKIKLRKSGYGEVISTDSSYQKGKSAPMSQIQYVVVDDVSASAITGITINGASNTLTLTENKSIDDIYAYCQWWGAQISNMDYEIPLVTTNSVNYSSTYNWILSGGNIAGSGNISLGSGTLTRTTESSTLPITYSSGAAVFGNITVSGLVANSRVRINNDTDNIELYNAVVTGTSVSIPTIWTADKSLDLRVTNVQGLTAYLPYQLSGVLTSSMASFTVSQTLDVVYNTIAIDGSTVTKFSTDYPNLQIDFSTAGIVTWQEMYSWYRYQEDGNQGIIYYFKAVESDDGVNFKIKTDVVDLYMDNTSGANITVVGGYLYRDDGTNWVYPATAHSIIPFYDRAYVAGGTTPAEIWSYPDRIITGGGGGGGGINYSIINSHTTKKINEAKEDIESKIKSIPVTEISLDSIEEKLNDNLSQNDIAKNEIIDKINLSNKKMQLEVKKLQSESKTPHIEVIEKSYSTTVNEVEKEYKEIIKGKDEKIKELEEKNRELESKEDGYEAMVEVLEEEIGTTKERIKSELIKKFT